MDVFTLVPLPALIGALAIGYVAGMVKGAIGFAMPLIIISTVSLFMDPKLVVAGLILPILVSNMSQMLRQGIGAAIAAAREFWLFGVVLMVTIFVTAQFMRTIPEQHIFLFLGLSVAIISAIQLSGWKPLIPQRFRAAASVVFGVFSGAMGGFAGTWGPPTVIYLLALNTPKAKQVTVQGVLFGLGGIPLFAGHVKSGILNAATLPFSVMMIVPVFLGMLTGFRIQDRIDQATFRKATLIVLMLAGINLIRRGLFG